MRSMRRLPLLLVLVPFLACAHKSDGAAVSLRRETVQEDKAQLSYELSYQPKGARKVELVLKLRVSGLEETNKLVAETYIKGFNIESGSTRWDGFVPPRQPQTVRVLLSIPEGNESASATVMLSRSHDSFSLLREELSFVVDADGQVRKQ
jgi:hypothetical protein